MHDHTFDTLTRRLATGVSRRGLLKRLAGGALAGALAPVRPHRGLADEQVLICYLTGSATNPVVLIEVDASAVPAHKAHGDAIDPDFSSDPAHCGGCFVSCAAGEACVDGACQTAACLALQAICDPANNRCCQDGPTFCAAVTGPECGDPSMPRCCHLDGSCTNDCDCCTHLVCLEDGRCGWV